MASELFHTLLAEARRRDCPRLHILSAIAENTASPTRLIPLVDEVIEAGREFRDGVHAAAAQHRLYRGNPYQICPFCHSVDCPGAVSGLDIPVAITVHIIEGGSFQDFL